MITFNKTREAATNWGTRFSAHYEVVRDGEAVAMIAARPRRQRERTLWLILDYATARNLPEYSSTLAEAKRKAIQAYCIPEGE